MYGLILLTLSGWSGCRCTNGNMYIHMYKLDPSRNWAETFSFPISLLLDLSLCSSWHLGMQSPRPWPQSSCWHRSPGPLVHVQTQRYTHRSHLAPRLHRLSSNRPVPPGSSCSWILPCLTHRDAHTYPPQNYGHFHAWLPSNVSYSLASPGWYLLVDY